MKEKYFNNNHKTSFKKGNIVICKNNIGRNEFVVGKEYIVIETIHEYNSDNVVVCDEHTLDVVMHHIEVENVLVTSVETLEVVDEVKARAWAEEHNCFKIDTGRAMQILRRELKMPKFFKRKIGADYLTVKKA